MVDESARVAAVQQVHRGGGARVGHRLAQLLIQPEDLPKIRELLTAEEYEKLLKRLEVGGNSCAGA